LQTPITERVPPAFRNKSDRRKSGGADGGLSSALSGTASAILRRPLGLQRRRICRRPHSNDPANGELGLYAHRRLQASGRCQLAISDARSVTQLVSEPRCFGWFIRAMNVEARHNGMEQRQVVELFDEAARRRFGKWVSSARGVHHGRDWAGS